MRFDSMSRAGVCLAGLAADGQRRRVVLEARPTCIFGLFYFLSFSVVSVCMCQLGKQIGRSLGFCVFLAPN